MLPPEHAQSVSQYYCCNGDPEREENECAIERNSIKGKGGDVDSAVFSLFLTSTRDDIITAQRGTMLLPIKFHKSILCSAQTRRAVTLRLQNSESVRKAHQTQLMFF